jgi:hypothetical protein
MGARVEADWRLNVIARMHGLLLAGLGMR